MSTVGMSNVVVKLKESLKVINAGKIDPAVLNNLKIIQEGFSLPLKSFVNIVVIDRRVLLVRPYDPGNIKCIEKALNQANLGATVQNDGNALRLSFPNPTEERRKELVKDVKIKCEQAKVSIRNIRRDWLDSIENPQERKSANKLVQSITDKFVKDIEDLAKDKEKELMTI